jgi:hypothetical protein
MDDSCTRIVPCGDIVPIQLESVTVQLLPVVLPLHYSVILAPRYHYRGRIANPATLKLPALQGSFTPQGVLFSPISPAGAPCQFTALLRQWILPASMTPPGKGATSPDLSRRQGVHHETETAVLTVNSFWRWQI